MRDSDNDYHAAMVLRRLPYGASTDALVQAFADALDAAEDRGYTQGRIDTLIEYHVRPEEEAQ
jgi:hypothetical protein